MKIRALIVDDEPPARDLIASLLKGEPDVEIVGGCANGRSAVAAIEQFTPELVFLDIQMPGLDGFGVLAELPAEKRPLTVFVTAHHEHAVRAFEAHALDYLLKPFEYARFGLSVQRVRGQLSHSSIATHQAKLVALLDDVQNRTNSWDRLAVHDSRGVIFLKPGEIDWIEADGNYVRLHCGKNSHLFRETMNAAETRLTGKKFLRVSRSAIVNLERIREWQPLFHGDSVLILENGARLTVTRGYRRKLEEVIARLA